MRIGRTVVCAAALVVFGTACSGAEEPVASDDADVMVETPAADGTSEQTPDDADGTTEADDDGADDGDATSSAPAVDAAEQGPALASTSHPVADQDATLAIELRAEETGDLLRVSLTFTPEGIGEGTSLAELLGSSGSGNGMSGRVIDADNLLEYGSVRAAVRHGDRVQVVDGQPVTLHFYVGAPQEPMERFDFLLDFGAGAPNWQGFVDVPYPGA